MYVSVSVHVCMYIMKCMYVPVCVCIVNVYQFLCKCMYMWILGDQRSKSVVFLHCPPSCFLRKFFH